MSDFLPITHALLAPNAILRNGDELRFATPMSHLTQYADESLDYERMQWRKVEKVWWGKTPRQFRSGPYLGVIEFRRKLSESLVL